MAFNRSLVSGLPEGANVQVIKGVPYVYFRYKWKDKTGKIKYSRDYLGIVDNGRFVPNDYYLRVRPTKKNRPEERWSVRAIAKLEGSLRKLFCNFAVFAKT